MQGGSFKFPYFSKFINWNFCVCNVINIDTMSTQRYDIPFFLRTSFWVNNSFTLLLEVPFLSVETYGRLFDVVATFKMQLINLQWNKN